MKFIMGLDQGTTSSRAIIFNKQGEIAGIAQKELRQIFPRQGWVEHNAVDICKSQLHVAKEALCHAGLKASDIQAIGITNQRETFVVWDKLSGEPVYNAIVWQCRRTAKLCDAIRPDFGEMIKAKTGLKLDPYFSGTKLKWLLDTLPELKIRAKKGELLFGTIDTWLIWCFTGGKAHVTDHTNASRTMLYNIYSNSWDAEILEAFDIPFCMLPSVIQSSQYAANCDILGANIPITGIAGDQQAALFGQACFKAGMAKNTYGTGCFLLMNTGAAPVVSGHGLITTMAPSHSGQIQYALEGSIFIGGAIIQWLRDELGLIKEASETEVLACTVPDTNGVYVVPAFVGLGAPYWNPHARGTITGLTRGANKAHIVRASLESMAYQTLDIVESMEKDAGACIKILQVDGGACGNDFLMQFQADILDACVERPQITETTALGAAYLAGLATGYWKSTEDIMDNRTVEKIFNPGMEESTRMSLVNGWRNAVSQALKPEVTDVL